MSLVYILKLVLDNVESGVSNELIPNETCSLMPTMPISSVMKLNTLRVTPPKESMVV